MDDQDELRKQIVVWECKDCENIVPRHTRFMPCRFCGGYSLKVTTLYERFHREKKE